VENGAGRRTDMLTLHLLHYLVTQCLCQNHIEVTCQPDIPCLAIFTSDIMLVENSSLKNIMAVTFYKPPVTMHVSSAMVKYQPNGSDGLVRKACHKKDVSVPNLNEEHRRPDASGLPSARVESWK
jgi:hypothetical protein